VNGERPLPGVLELSRGSIVPLAHPCFCYYFGESLIFSLTLWPGWVRNFCMEEELKNIEITPELIKRIEEIIDRYIETHQSKILEEYYNAKERVLLERARKVEEELRILREKDLAEIEALKKRWQYSESDKEGEK